MSDMEVAIIATLIITVASTYMIVASSNAVKISAAYCINKGMDIQKIGGWGGVKACVDGNGVVRPILSEGE